MYDTEPDYADPGRQRQSVPEQFRCCVCGWRGKGVMARANHWQRTGHGLIVPKADPRYDVPAAERKAG